jgi:uncharacterized protein YecA (UPF0149 family)
MSNITTLDTEQKADIIFKLNKDINDFIQSDTKIKNEFEKYIKSPGADKNIYDFIFDKTFDDGEKLIDIYLKKNSKLPAEEKMLLEEMKNAIKSVFEVRNIDKNGFELYSLLNEKTYNVKSLIKMVNYRSIYKGSYLVCRIIPVKGEFYLHSLYDIIRQSNALVAYRIAVAELTETPSLAWLDNDEKLEEIEKNVVSLAPKFKEFFPEDIFITDNNMLEGALNVFDEYAAEGKKETDIKQFLRQSDEYVYFDTTQAENASRLYDVGIMFDPESGLQTVPFYATFCRIFEVEDYKTVESYKECVKYFLNNNKILPFVLKKTYERFGDTFLQRIAEILKLKEKPDFDGLMNTYKKEILGKKNFSIPTILYNSSAFNRFMELSIEATYAGMPAAAEKVGRNDPCPCGSGKKYKKCCM